MFKADLLQYVIKPVEVTYFTDSRVTVKRTGYEHSEPRFSYTSAFFEHEHEAVKYLIEKAENDVKRYSEQLVESQESISFINSQIEKLKKDYGS